MILIFAEGTRGEDRKDLYGDPLPEGAHARLGTARLRSLYGGPTAITPDGKHLLGLSPSGGVNLYDPATGKASPGPKLDFALGTPLLISGDGKRGVSAGFEGSAVWDVLTSKVLAKIPRPSPGENGLAPVVRWTAPSGVRFGP
jgi:hypothetical protein